MVSERMIDMLTCSHSELALIHEIVSPNSIIRLDRGLPATSSEALQALVTAIKPRRFRFIASCRQYAASVSLCSFALQGHPASLSMRSWVGECRDLSPIGALMRVAAIDEVGDHNFVIEHELSIAGDAVYTLRGALCIRRFIHFNGPALPNPAIVAWLMTGGPRP